MVLDDALLKADQLVLDAERTIRMLHYCEPINAREEKEAFLCGHTDTPSFSYHPLGYDPCALAERIVGIELPEADLSGLLAQKRDEVLLKNRIVTHRGDEAIVREASITLNGVPDAPLVEDAIAVLGSTPHEDDTSDLPASVLKSSLEERLRSYGLTDWTVEYAHKDATTVYPSQQVITIGETRRFSTQDQLRLLVHEIDVHVLRAQNGYAQPLSMFATGLAGYDRTEEGLALTSEHRSGTLSNKIMRIYAMRVLAVDALCEDRSFKEAYARLMDMDVSEGDAWTATMRAYRAGGLVKDHIYLGGFRDVSSFVENGGDIITLYTGKIGLSHVPHVRELLVQGTLVPAKHIPGHMLF